MASYEEERQNAERKREGTTRDSYKEKTRSQGRERLREKDHGSERLEKDHDNDRHQLRSHDGGRSRDKERDREHKSRDRSKENGRRHHDYDGDRRHMHRNRSRSRGRSRDRSRSRARSRERKSKRASGFDMAPAVAATSGAVSGQLAVATQATMQGAFPFPGTQFPALPMQAMTQQATRHARRVYVGGLPAFANEQTIATFFSQVMAAIGGNTAGPGDAVVNVYINHEKKFAFVEMRTVEEASNAMSLDGIVFEGQTVRVRRPSDYNPSLAATLGPSQPSRHLNLAAVGLAAGTSSSADGPDKVFVGGLPYYLTEAQIRELLESFGPLRGFDLVKDWETGNSKGYAFCVYQDNAVTDVACTALNGLKMGDKTLTVRRASASAQQKTDQSDILFHAQQQIAMQKLVLQTGGAASFVGLQGLLGVINEAPEVPTKVVCLNQLVSVDDLSDDQEYEDICEDIKEECGKFGTVTNLIIPRPLSTGEHVPGLGKAFVEYSNTDGSVKAKNSLHQRKFAGNVVIASYYPEDKFARKELDG